MKFDLDSATQVLTATPAAIKAILRGFSDDWTAGSDRNDWQPLDILGHLIHGEETDWIPRARLILDQGDNPTFEPFDRFAQFDRSKGKSTAELLDEFESLRRQNLGTLRSWNLGSAELALKGNHPELGQVTLAQLLATWVVHDLNHIRQLTVTLARRYESEVGPWKAYLAILQ